MHVFTPYLQYCSTFYISLRFLKSRLLHTAQKLHCTIGDQVTEPLTRNKSLSEKYTLSPLVVQL